MPYSTTLWLNLLRLRIKLLALLFTQLFIADVWVLIITLELPVFYLMLWFLYGNHFQTLTFLYLAFIVLRYIQQFFTTTGNADPDPPLFQQPTEHPKLADLLTTIQNDFHRPTYTQIAFLLSPVPWREFACSAPALQTQTRTAVIPIGCLGIYSVFDLRCQLAHTLVHHHARWLVPAITNNLAKLQQIARTRRFGRVNKWQVTMNPRLQNAYLTALANYQLITDLAADTKIAARYGAFAVSTWIQRSHVANHTVDECLISKIVPLAEEGVLLPIAETCHAYYTVVEKEWLPSLTSQMRAEERSGGANPTPLLVRLAALQHGLQTAGGLDPRPATTLIENLPTLEESVARHEISAAENRTLTRPATNEIAAQVLLPRMRKELSRNAELLQAKTVADIPHLLENAEALAAVYKLDPRYLLAEQQRKALIPDLLISFLTVELIDAGWRLAYSAEDGLTLHSGSRTVHPFEFVRGLAEKTVDHKEFDELCR